MKTGPWLCAWLELADELEAFQQFMLKVGMSPRRMTRKGTAEVRDTGLAAANRIRKIAANRWTWASWKRDNMREQVRSALHTFHRWEAEGAFYRFEGTFEHQEMMRRIACMERKFNALDSLRRGVESS